MLPDSGARHCPWCGTEYADASLVQEFWARDERWFSCWCDACGRSAEVGIVGRVVVTGQFRVDDDGEAF